MPFIIENGKEFFDDEKLGLKIECGKHIPSVLKVPPPLPKPLKLKNYLKDNIMVTKTQNIDSKKFNLTDSINADLNFSLDDRTKAKFKPIKVNNYDVIFVRNNSTALRYCFDYLGLDFSVTENRNNIFKNMCVFKKTIFINADTLLLIDDVDKLINGYKYREINSSNISVSNTIKTLQREKNMNGELLAIYISNPINECYNLA